MSNFIAKQRKLSTVQGTGIQYIPGHIEEFVDLILDKYLPESGNIVDLAGGGLRFAIPAALKGKNVTVVDLDDEGLDTNIIIEKLVEQDYADQKQLTDCARRITSVKKDILAFLNESADTFGLITSFRFIHFLNPEQMNTFFKLARARLADNGILAVSCTSRFQSSTRTHSEIFDITEPINPKNIYWRKFKDNDEVKKIIAPTNLAPEIHVMDEEHIHDLAKKHSFQVLAAELSSTRVVNGYILK